MTGAQGSQIYFDVFQSEGVKIQSALTPRIVRHVIALERLLSGPHATDVPYEVSGSPTRDRKTTVELQSRVNWRAQFIHFRGHLRCHSLLLRKEVHAESKVH